MRSPPPSAPGQRDAARSCSRRRRHRSSCTRSAPVYKTTRVRSRSARHMCVQRMASTAAWQWGRVEWSWTGGVRSCACRTRWRARRQPRLQRSRSTARRPHGAPSPSPASVWLRTSQVGELCGGGSCCWRAIFRVTQRGHIGHRRPALAGRLVRRTRSGDTLSSASSGKIKHVNTLFAHRVPVFVSQRRADRPSLAAAA